MSINNLSAWFRKRPKWLQRTASELLENGHLDDKDVIDLAELCLKEVVGAAEDLEYTFSSDVFRADTTDSLHLCSIGDVQNIRSDVFVVPHIPKDITMKITMSGDKLITPILYSYIMRVKLKDQL